MVQSLLTNTSYSACSCLAASSLLPDTWSPSASSMACAVVRPASRLIFILMIFSGCDSARSSMEVPPSLHAMIMGPALARSNRIAKYISFTSFSFCATSSVSTGLPAAPVCFVTRVCPNILRLSASASPTGTMCTPPRSPLVKLPKPRPPANTWLFTTTCPLSPPSFLAAADTSSGVRHAMPGGTRTPYLAMSSELWNSWMFRRRICWSCWAGAAAADRTTPRALRVADAEHALRSIFTLFTVI
mmetsp:Transcript_798/g.1874  ORF Transcript_798/g.1874 Transcript_798/m.1874 type:complete len:244 (+) Transcript_798:909-1640(+)